MRGRAFRFLGIAVGGWAMARAGLLWPTIDPLPAPARAMVAPVAAYAAVAQTSPPRPAMAGALSRQAATVTPAATMRPAPVAVPIPVVAPPVAGAFAPAQPPPLRLPPLAPPAGAAPDRLAVSLWAVARGGIGDPRPGSQLGGSQAGLRATYVLDPGRRVALAARLSGAVAGRGREAALGIDWQPAGRALHLVAEQRVAIDGGGGGSAAFVIAGLDPVPLAGRVRVEAYGQAGGVLRDGRIDPFADAALRLARPVAAARTGLRLDLGIGGWAGAQREAARLDIGPGVALAMPLGRHRLRATLDWRQRVAGRASPGSGPVLAIGADL